MSEKESVIKNRILLALGRKVSGIFWNHPTGSAVPVYVAERCQKCGAKQENQQRITFGFEGSPDIIGVRTVTVTSEMVGQRIGLATGIEVKTATGRQRPEQKKFQAAFTAAGGQYILARSVDDLDVLK